MIHLVRHTFVTTLLATALVGVFSLFVVVGSLDASGIRLFPLALILAVGMPALVVPAIVYPLLTVTRRQTALHAELQRLALTDVLTDLPNRRAFFETAEQMMRPAAASAFPLCAMMVDVDRFKTINDRFGHDNGDKVLKRVASVIAEEVSTAAVGRWVVARLGGEEFAVLIEGLAPSAVARLASSICNQVHRQVGAGERLEAVTVSIGVAFRDRHAGIDRLLKDADDAVYYAKNAGRDRWAFAANEKKSAAETRLAV